MLKISELVEPVVAGSEQTLSELARLIIEGLSLVGLTVTQKSPIFIGTALILLLVFCWLGYRLTHILLTSKLTRFVVATKSKWDDELLSHGFFRRGAHLVPGLLLYLSIPYLFAHVPGFASGLEHFAYIYVLITLVSMFSAAMNTAEDIYKQSKMAKRVPITGFVQVAKLIVTVFAVILIVANLLDKSPVLIVSGLGAVTAILLLVFKDTILGFVAGV